MRGYKVAWMSPEFPSVVPNNKPRKNRKEKTAKKGTINLNVCGKVLITASVENDNIFDSSIYK